jgi:hypothetical protein
MNIVLIVVTIALAVMGAILQTLGEKPQGRIAKWSLRIVWCSVVAGIISAVSGEISAQKSDKRVASLEERQMARTLKPKQRSKLVESMKRYSGQRIVLIEYAPSKEASDFCRELGMALTNAGWVSKFNGLAGGRVETEQGVMVLVSKGQENIPAAVALTDCLNSIGIQTRSTLNEGHIPIPLDAGVVGLFVSPRADVR